ncbi:hypothetical protein HpBGD97_15000 [Helicobacter pylori]
MGSDICIRDRLNEIILNTILSALNNRKSQDFVLIFSVHGLPKSVIDAGDTYPGKYRRHQYCILYTSDAADDLTRVASGRYRVIHKNKLKNPIHYLT